MSKQINNKPSKHNAIPGDWEVKTLGELCKIYVGRDLKENNFSTIENETYKYPVFSNTVDNNGLYGFYNSPEYTGESLTIVGRGAGLGTAFTRKGSFGAIGRLLILFPVQNVSAHYITEYVNNNLIIHQESGGIPQLTGEQIARYKIVIPNYPEQKAIAHILSLMDTAINKNNFLIAKKELQKKWLMQMLLTGKKRLKGFEDKWSEIQISDVFDFVKSYSHSRDNLTYDSLEGSIYNIHYGDIHAVFENDVLDMQTANRIPYLKKEFGEEFEFLKDGDIIIADASEDYEGVGESVEIKNIGNKKVIGGLHTIVLRDNSDKTVDDFRAFLFNGERVLNFLRKVATGISVYGISKLNIASVKISLPSKEEQTAIAKILQAADKEIQLLKSKTEKLREEKKGLMQVLLTGKKRLKV